MDQQTGKIIITGRILIVMIGIIIYFFHDYFKWIGKLPGDIRIERENFLFYFPLATMIVFSLLITIIVNIFKKLF